MTYRGSAYRLYQKFDNELSQARAPDELLAVCARLLPALKAQAAAIISHRRLNTTSHGATSDHDRPEATVIGTTGLSPMWSAYTELCRSNHEPLSRLLRLSPHPVALSDIHHHPRLGRRTQKLARLFGAYGVTDALAIPVVDRQIDQTTTMIVAGSGWTLRPTHRYLLSQMASDLIARMTACAGPNPAVEKSIDLPHLKLTSRQMEIAGWLIEGKTDWEIGEILRISPKTVNFHVENIKRVYGVKSRNQFVAAIVRDGGLCPA